MDKNLTATADCFSFLKDQGYNVVYVALFGSQNYGMETPTSDYDFKAIVVPTIRDLALNSSPVSKTIEYNGGLIDVKDVRVAIDCFKKMNPSYIEILFTKWYWVNKRYKEFMWFRSHRDEIAHADEARAINALMGNINNKFAALRKDTPAQHDIIEKWGYSGKQLAHLIRYEMMMIHYFDAPYLDLVQLQKEDADWLTKVKQQGLGIMPDVAEQCARTHVDHAETMFKRYKNREDLVLNKELFSLMDECKVDIIEKALRFELES